MIASVSNSSGRTSLSDRKLHSVGNYKLSGTVLGKGHFARVEEAIHVRLNVKVAIKIFDLKRMTDKYMMKHLRREALILSMLSHPSIVALYEVHETDSNYFLVEEIGEGGNLSEHVRSQKFRRLDDKRARSFCQQLTSAVSHLHQRGVIHRDLKMDNILLDKNKELIKLTDFGLSNIWTPSCFLSTHCGSPEYAAPELFVYNKRYGPEIDIWSLGVVFYAMILGRLPFTAIKRPNETNDDNRSRLVAELKLGLVARHRIEMQSCNVLFKIIIPKMLVPTPKDRISIDKLMSLVLPVKPAWVEFPVPTDDWKYSATEKIAYDMNIPIDEVHRKLQSNPLSSIGGIFNIRRHIHQLRQLNLSTPPRQVNFKTTMPSPPSFTTHDFPSRSVESAKTKTPPADSKPNQQTRNFYFSGSDSTASSNSTCRQIPVVLRPRTTARPKTPQNTNRPVAVAASADRRCKTATGNLETAVLSVASKLRPSTDTTTQRTVQAPTRLSKSRATKTNPDPVPTPFQFGLLRRNPEWSRNAGETVGMGHEHLKHITDFSDGKANNSVIRKISTGVPTHTAARAAKRLEKAKVDEQDRNNRVKSLETRRVSIGAKVRTTIDQISRSFSKFLKEPTKKNEHIEDLSMYGDTKAIGRRKVSSTIKPIEKSSKEKALGVGSSKLVFWRKTTA